MINNSNRLNIIKRQKSVDYGFITHENEDTNRIQMQQHQLKSVDEKDFTDFEDFDRSERASSLKDSNHKSEEIKLAAIYDDKVEIVKILSSETTMDSG